MKKRLDRDGWMDIYIALAHHPVKNRTGDTVTTAVTNIDIHDLARVSRSYGIRGYFVVTPIDQQRSLVDRVVTHWRDGEGASFNPLRAASFTLVRTAHDLEEALQAIQDETGHAPLTVVTGAGFDEGAPRSIGYAALRERIETATGSLVLVFGTGWGLVDSFIEGCDLRLPAIRAAAGRDNYNHLSVRSAVAIILDRLLGAH